MEMFRLCFEFVACLTFLAAASMANEDVACGISAVTGPDAPAQGHSMLQTKRQREEFPLPTTPNSSEMVEGQPVCLGSSATLDEEGYQAVAETCCQLEMDVYVRRVIDSLSLQLCDEGGLTSLLSLYTTCGEGHHDFASLTNHIRTTAASGTCAFVATGGACPTTPRSSGCLGEPAPEAHRRRTCKKRKEISQHNRTATLVQAEAHSEAHECPLPAGAVWCEVRLKNLAPFFIAAYDWSKTGDVVSKFVCWSGHWEEDDMSTFGPPGHLLDIGGNIGYYTFAFAQAGWTVTTFEPMLPNLALMGASLCRNPHLAPKIHLNWFGLGAKSQQCKMMAPPQNMGDGFTRCEDEHTPMSPDEYQFVEIGKFNIRRLDEVLVEQAITKVDLVKIDVEGYELQVFKGAGNFLNQYRPRLIKSEVWYSLVGYPQVNGVDYITMFEGIGYKTFADSRCQVPLDAKAKLMEGSIDVFFCK